MAKKVTARARRVARSSGSVAGGNGRGAQRRAGSTKQASESVNQALKRAVSDAQDIGSGLGTAGTAVAKGTVKLAYDVGAIMGLAGTSVLSGTVALARDIIHRAETLFVAPPSAATPTEKRKPLHRARSVPRRSAESASEDVAATA